MSTAYWCLLLAILFPYVFCILAKSGPGFDNNNPREYLERLKGWRKRAHWVQLNSFEILPSFAAAVIIGHQFMGFQPVLDILAIGFILMRVLYAICYIAEKSLLRTVCWTISFIFVLAIFLISNLHYSQGMHFGYANHGKFCADDKFKGAMYKRDKMKNHEFKRDNGINRNEPGNGMPNHSGTGKVMSKPGAANHEVVNPGHTTHKMHPRNQVEGKAAQSPGSAHQQNR